MVHPKILHNLKKKDKTTLNKCTHKSIKRVRESAFVFIPLEG